MPPLGHSVESTFISITELAVRDMAGFQVEAITTPALQASDIAFDLIPPYLTRYDFDLDTGTIVLTFSEAVDISTLVLSRITLVNEEDIALAYENFTLNIIGNTTITPLSAAEIELSLTPEELNVVKMLTDLATSNIDTYLTLEANVINDPTGNDALPIPAPDALVQALPDMARNLSHGDRVH